ncbi:putative inactive tRNA-specific adenosine deaminase-like protein 3 [Amphibalanus amphitrite]|uniref:Putative inactive tRNA-specific adenosine deaminase-like protein 3 n=1 Tax=Amphibalanus amphitrite TaxID=1232801 RepID=A0A6A4X3E6_AMPAM|nr:putative inactive tRNA-specific adenosine deaminase-like protein 3 [Amphibalanus amphitrite]
MPAESKSAPEVHSVTVADDMPFHLTPVLSDSVVRALPVQTALVAHVCDRRQTAALVARLAAELPVPALAHLKRVRTARLDGAPALLLLIDLLENVFPTVGAAPPACDGAPRPLGRPLSDLQAALAERGVTAPLTGLGPQLYCAAVAAGRPITRRQYDQAAALWPTVFHRDLRVEASLAPPAAGPGERRRLLRWMATAAAAAAGSAGPRVGCAVVDPATDRLVAVAGDARACHRLQHAVMRAVDAVAAAQGGGVWTRAAAAQERPETGSAPTESASPTPAAPSSGAQSQPPDPEAPPPERREGGSDGPSVQRPPAGALPYLCTGYDAFVTREPCIMCAMALLHSRIGRVFYAVPRAGGALGSACKLHVADGLNHRFQVFSGLGAELCAGHADGEATNGCATDDTAS